MTIQLAKKFRPQKFSEVAGQQKVIEPIKNAIKGAEVSQAFLFHGPAGTGKTTLARIVAKSLNCENRDGVEPCNECGSCKRINSETSMDAIEINASDNRGINEVRQIREQVSSASLSKKFRVFILDEVHMFTPEASNALLKTLEEPPNNVVFVLATTEPNKVLPTIRSRCQMYGLSPLDEGSIKKQLQKISTEIGLSIEPRALDLITRGSRGGMRNALQFLEKVANSKGKGAQVTIKDVAEVFGTVSFSLLFSFFTHVYNSRADKVIVYLDNIISDGIGIDSFWQDFHDLLRDINVVKRCDKPRSIVAYDDDSFAKLSETTAKLNAAVLLDAWKLALETLNQIKNPALTGMVREIAEEASIRMSDLSWSQEAPAAKVKVAEPVTTHTLPESPAAPAAAAEVAAPVASGTPSTAGLPVLEGQYKAMA